MNDGRLIEIGRFPVKSMLGESPDAAALTASGLVGDRTHSLFDCEGGKVASAKDPRKWAQLLGFRAVHSGEPGTGDALTITLPDGTELRSDDPSVNERLSAATGREVELRSETAADAGYDYVWDVEGIAPEEVVVGSQTDTTADGKRVSTMPLAFMAPGTFQDVAPITIMTTAALAAMKAQHPEGDWNPVRFRSNFLIDVEGDDIVENGWNGRQLAVGDVVIEVASAAPRCVMTTLAQQGLPRDRKILQTVAKHNMQEFAGMGLWACLGAYATVVTPGQVSVGDPVTLL